MASTKIADIIIPEVFAPYVVEKTAEVSNLIQSGIVIPDAEMNALASGGGKLINMPFFKDLTGDDEVLTDSSALTVNNISTGQDIAHLLMRGKAWGVNDLAKALSGADPMGEIAGLVANYWARQEQKVLINALNGVFASASMSGLMLDIASEDANTSGKLLDASAFIDAQGLLGDAQDKLTAVVVHSTVYNNWRKANLIDFLPASSNNDAVQIPYFLGKRVIVDDGVPVVAGATSGYKYTTYLFGEGAVARGEGGAPVPVETDRDSLAGEDILIHRRHFILHPRGIKFTASSVAGASPTNAELALGANWERVYDVKNIRIVKVVTNG